MKKIVVSLIFVLFAVVSASAQKSVSYSFRPLSSEGCHVSFSVTRQADGFSLCVVVNSSGIALSQDPVLKVETFGGDILELRGENCSRSSVTGGMGVSMPVGGGSVLGIIPYSETVSMALFRLSDGQFSALSSGVHKLRLSTLPHVHERVFERDRIGGKIFRMYRKQKDSDIFEENNNNYEGLFDYQSPQGDG